MASRLAEIFADKALIDRIKKRLPYLYQLAELESSRAGKIGMQVGSLRENIMVALLIYKFGENNVNTEIPIIESEIDVELYGYPISIKTITGKNFSGVKLIWTVDAEKAQEFLENYYPHCDILFVQIVWNNLGGLYYIPTEIQRRVFNSIGKEKYIKLPKPGTNPRGVEISKEALSELVSAKDAQVIEINWQKTDIEYKPYQRWVDYWSEE